MDCSRKQKNGPSQVGASSPSTIKIPYARQFLDKEDLAGVCQALKGEWISRSTVVAQFENALAEYCGAPFAVAFSNGSAALLAACIALDLGPADRVYVPANSFIATATCAAVLGCSMVFVDIDARTGLLDIDAFCAQFTPNTQGKSALLPVHFAGRGVDLAHLRIKLGDPELLLIEDAAHAMGGVAQDNQPVGSCAQSDACAFSFHASKNMTTGEGGAVTTRSATVAHALRRARDSGIERESALQKASAPGPWYYEVQEVSGNLHLTDFQAALGLSQLRKLDRFQSAKTKLITRYIERLSPLSQVHLPTFTPGESWHFHLFFMCIDFEKLGRSRGALMRHLRERAIGSQVHYIPLYSHPCWKAARWQHTWNSLHALPGCERFYSQMLSLPLYVELQERQVDEVCDEIQAWLQQSGN